MKLRDYQKECLSKIVEMFKNGKHLEDETFLKKINNKKEVEIEHIKRRENKVDYRKLYRS